MAISFQKAVKYEAKGRVALIGPAGSGKSYTMLTMARLLAGPMGKIAAVDTEQGSLSKYADLFDFDVVSLKSFSPDNFLDALRAAEQGGYAVFCCDSLSHFWMGKDGALEFVDTAKKRSSSRDDMSGWKEFRPHERAMVDAMIASPLHMVVTMRTKTAYEEQVNERTGKKQRVKIGLAPVQREGLEYEFDLVGLMDEDNTFIVDKTRCPAFSGKAITKPKAEDFAPFRDWLAGGAPAPSQGAPTAPAPASASPAPASAPRIASDLPRMNGNVLVAVVTDASERTSKNGGKAFTAVKIKGFVPVGDKKRDLFTCWHASLGYALKAAPGKVCQFETEEKDGWLNIVDVLAVGEQEYRDGKPLNPDAEPESAPAKADVQPNSHGLFITDEDIPF